MIQAETDRQEQRLIWSFWLAAAIALVGGLLPFVFGGTSSRLTLVIVPYAVGAVGLAACAFLHNQSRAVVAIVYFVAGLAIIYGLMSMFALPLKLAALGSCPIAPQPCPSGLPRVLSDGENNGLGSAATFGILAMFIGFFGLVTLYRRYAPPPFVPPVRKIPPMPPAPPPAPPPESPDQPLSAPAQSAGRADELEAPEPEPELPAPEEPPELPSHESSPANS